MDAICTPNSEPNYEMLEAYESMHYDELNHITFPIPNKFEGIFDRLQAGEHVEMDITYAPKKHRLTRQYHANEVYGCGRTGAEIMAQNIAREEEEAVVQNLNNQFDEAAFAEETIDDLLINIKSAFPFLNLKDIAGQISRIYSDSETLESFVPGQRIGDYEYMTIETNYCVMLFGRKNQGDNYATIHYWLK
jgi:hypothetical protein